tara:strand:+ start:9089 stop:10405 length:1317 start_codon:yes stop_codon:yes gene_type:complete
MAKKQSLNYGPNTALIKGARDVAQSEAAMTSAGGTAFAQSFTGAILTGIEEQEKRNSIRDAYLADLGGIQNINLLDEDYNKQAVTNFVRQKRDEYAKLADAYARTKDTNILDKMENIKFSFSNLNNQLKGLANERVSYLEAYDKGQIIDIPQRGDSIYTMAYTNKGQFSVDGTGNIGFNIDGKTTMFKDIVGKYNVKSNIGEAFVLEQGLKARNTGERGGKFYRDDTKNIYKFKFKETGPEGIMVMAKTDLTGDDNYQIGQDKNGNPIYAGNLSFESMWSQGLLDEKFYKTFKSKGGTDWMYEDKNVDILNDLISEYYTDVTESMYTPAKQEFDNRPQRSGKPASIVIGGSQYNAQTFNSSFAPYINRLAKLKEGDVETSPTGVKFTVKNGEYYRVSGMEKGKPVIDEDQGPMTLQGVGSYEGWGNYINFEDPLNPNK